tara:strand:- start:432 stop:614 length:183 start_codon:yes stop_codon:yes gene_type:complete
MAYKADYERWLKEQQEQRWLREQQKRRSLLSSPPPLRPVMPEIQNKVAPAPTRVRDKKKK